MYWDDEGLFGRDMRHRQPPQILLPARFAYEYINDKRDYDGLRSRRIAELEVFAEIFDCPGAVGGDSIYMAGGYRYVLPTWRLGRIEIDIYRENYLLLPEQDHRLEVYERLNKAGFYYQIIGEKEFINIKRTDNNGKGKATTDTHQRANLPDWKRWQELQREGV